MFKNKFKEFVQNKKELSSVSFEILNDKLASALIGGCKVLQSCGVFHGNCDRLIIGNCGKFYPHIESDIN